MARNFVEASTQEITSPVPAGVNGASTLTMSMWSKRSAINLGCAFEVSTNSIDFFAMGIYDNNTFYCYHRNAGVRNYSTIEYWGNIGKWVHTAFVFNGGGVGDGDKLKVYKNGVLQSISFITSIPSTTISSNLTNVHIGFSIPGGRYSTGNIAECKIYSQNLNANQVYMDMLGLFPVQPIFYQRLGVGSPEPDWSGNGLNGTLINAPPVSDHPPVRSPYIQTGLVPYLVAGGGTLAPIVSTKGIHSAMYGGGICNG